MFQAEASRHQGRGEAIAAMHLLLDTEDPPEPPCDTAEAEDFCITVASPHQQPSPSKSALGEFTVFHRSSIGRFRKVQWTVARERVFHFILVMVLLYPHHQLSPPPDTLQLIRVPITRLPSDSHD
jgi:hypothetical protein